MVSLCEDTGTINSFILRDEDLDLRSSVVV